MAELQQTIPTAVISVATKATFKEELKKLEKAMMAERKEQIAKQLESAIAEAEKVMKEVKEKQEGGRVFYTVEGIDSSNASKLMQKIRELDSENSYFIFSVDAAKVAMYALVAKEKASKTFSAKTALSVFPADAASPHPGAALRQPSCCAQHPKLTSQNQTYLKSPLFVRYSVISLFSSFLSYQIYQETQPKTSFFPQRTHTSHQNYESISNYLTFFLT